MGKKPPKPVKIMPAANSDQNTFAVATQSTKIHWHFL